MLWLLTQLCLSPDTQLSEKPFAHFLKVSGDIPASQAENLWFKAASRDLFFWTVRRAAVWEATAGVVDDMPAENGFLLISNISRCTWKGDSGARSREETARPPTLLLIIAMQKILKINYWSSECCGEPTCGGDRMKDETPLQTLEGNMHVPDKQKHTHTQLRPRKEKKRKREGGRGKKRKKLHTK